MTDWLDEHMKCLALHQKMVEDNLEWQRKTAEHEHRMQGLGMCVEMYMNAELGPSFAMLNPDPAVYPIARKGADEMQALALKTMSEYGFTP